MMGLGTLFVKELRFRGVSFFLGALAIAAAAACLVGSRAFLISHDSQTNDLCLALEKRASDRMAHLRNEARIFSKNLGFNILLLPEEQDLGALYGEEGSTVFFTQSQADALGGARLSSLNHLLPMLRQKITWDAFGGEVILMGIQGEIYIKAPKFQKPIEEAIDPGQIHMGDAVGRRLNVKEGDRVNLLGRSFAVRRLLPPKGNVDDITLLMNLNDVQTLLKKGELVSGILALSCTCAEGNLDLIRNEVRETIPNAQVVEFSVRAKARMRARSVIQEETNKELTDIRENRDQIRKQITDFTSMLVVLIFVCALFFVGLLAMINARERRSEVAMLRALGLTPIRILMLFLFKAAIIGGVGGLLGVGASSLISQVLPPMGYILLVVFSGILVSMLASMAPALLAILKDPAKILNQG